MVGVWAGVWAEVRGDVVAIVTLFARYRAMDSVTLIGTFTVFNRAIALKVAPFGNRDRAGGAFGFYAWPG